MAVLAKPRDAVIVIDKNKVNQFLEDSKKNIITPEFLSECQDSAKLFKRGAMRKVTGV